MNSGILLTVSRQSGAAVMPASGLLQQSEQRTIFSIRHHTEALFVF